MEQSKYPKRLLIIGNGFDLDLGRATRYSDFAKSDYWPKGLESRLYKYLTQKSYIEKWFDLEGELANYVVNLNKSLLPAYKFTAFDIAKEDSSDFAVIVDAMIKYLSKAQSHELRTDSWAAKIFKLVCHDLAFSKIYSFNYSDLSKIVEELSLERSPAVEYVHGCLSDKSAILGINDQVDTIKGAFDFLRKSFNPHYASHPVSYDLKDADEVVFFGHSLGDNDYHYFQSFFRHQCEEDMEPKEKRTITIFTYNESSRMEIMRTLHKMNDGKTSLLFQNNDLNIFCTSDADLENNPAFRNWISYRNKEIERFRARKFFEDIAKV